MKGNKQVLSGIIWSYAEKFGIMIVSLVISAIIARYVAPEDYGAIVLLTVFLNFSNTFNVGLNSALIQKKEINETDLSTVFYSSFVVSLVLYALLYFIAPYVASFYQIPALSPVLRFASLSVPFGAYNSVQTAIITRELQFKRLFIGSLISISLSGIIGIVTACKGWGVWALALNNLLVVIISCIALQFMVNWRPRPLFSFDGLTKLLSYGWKITCSSMVDVLYSSVINIVIGKKYSSADLAYYDRGQRLPLLAAQNVTSSISTVMFPVFSDLQDEKDKLKHMASRTIKLSTFVMFPLLVGLAVCSRPLILTLYGETWINSVFYMQLFCFAFLFYPVNIANMQLLNGLGRSDLFLKLNIIKKIVGITSIVLSMNFGVKAIAVGYMISSFLNVSVNIIPNKKQLNYGFFEQMKDIFPSLALSGFMYFICSIYLFLPLGNLTMLLLQITTGIAVYIIGARLLKLEPFFYLLSLIKNAIKKKV